jgi:hypothetical protein
MRWESKRQADLRPLALPWAACAAALAHADEMTHNRWSVHIRPRHGVMANSRRNTAAETRSARLRLCDASQKDHAT